MSSSKVSIILPAAGAGRRCLGAGPRSLYRVAPGQSLLERQVAVIREVFPRAELIVVVGFETEKMLAALPAGVRVVENERFVETSVNRSILLGLRVALGERLLIIYGDMLFESAALRVLPRRGSAVLVDDGHRLGSQEVGVGIHQQAVQHFSYGLPVKWANMVQFQGRELRLLRGLVEQRRTDRLLGFELLNLILEQGGGFLPCFCPPGELREIDSPRDLRKEGLPCG